VTTTVVVGNPKPASRTLEASILLADKLTGHKPDHVIDLIDLGAGLLDWADGDVAAAIDTVQSSSFVVFGSPTFKATYTGLLKLFLDRFAGGTGLAGILSVPLMLGAAPTHALAPDLTLKPVLTELGGTCALPGLYLMDSSYTEDPALDAYVERWRPVVNALSRTAGTS
jgi:FMN reductase